MAEFERGITLSRKLKTTLNAAEQKVQVLIERDAAEELAPFDDDELTE